MIAPNIAGEAGELAFAEKTSGTRYLGLQWIRIIACLMVLWFHGTLYIRSEHFPVYYRGAVGVDLFFVLSGFVIVVSSRRLAGLASGWKTFAKHRVLRVVPMYWLITTLNLILLAVAARAHGLPHPNGVWVLCSYLFVPYHSAALEPGPVLGVGWTLEFEMLFYALCTAVLAARRKLLPYAYVPLVLLAVGSVWRAHFSQEIFRFLDPVVLEFGFGMFIAHRCIRKQHLPAALAWSLAFGATILLFYWPWPHVHGFMVATGIPAAVLIYATASLEHRLPRTPRWVLVCADATYLLYLIHVPILLEISKAAGRHHMRYGEAAIAIGVLLSAGIAIVLRIAVEAPLLRWLQPERRRA